MDKLDLYNDALLLLGQRQLASLTEDREPRHRLDGAYSRAAINYCLELVRPNFASKTATLDSPGAGTTFTSTHSMPADYVTMVMPYSDQKLDQEINRYIIEGNSLKCDYDTVYLRYIAEEDDINNWTPAFFRVVAAYLATQTCSRLSPDDQDAIKAEYLQRLASAQDIEQAKTPKPRSSATSVTMSDSWRRIYNDALQIMGLDEITSNSDDSNRRTKLDKALDAGIVADLLEDTGWQFGFQSVKIQHDPSVNPAWGHQYAIPKPIDLHRLDGLYTDEHMSHTLIHYEDHSGYWFTGCDTLYCRYRS